MYSVISLKMSVFSVKHLTGWILCFESELYCVFFTRFLTSLRIWEGYSTYKDAQDYAENACSSSERYTGKKKGCVLALMLSVCTQHHYVCPTSASSRDYFIFGSDRVLAPVCLPDSAGASLWVPPISGDDASGIWLYWISDPDEKVCPNHRNYFTLTCCVCVQS